MNLRWTGILLGLCLVAMSAFPHPMGNFSISHYARMTFSPEKIDLLYLIDMAEIPAFQEKPLLDLNGNGTIEESEQNAYLSRKVGALSEGLVVWLNGTRYPLERVSQQLELQPGGLNLPTLRIFLRYEIPLKADQLKEVNVLEYRDTNFAGHVGWKEIVVQGEGIQESSAPRVDKSQQLSHYPEDPAIRPPADLAARVRFKRIATPANAASRPMAAPPGRLISVALWTALLAAFGGGVFLAWRWFSRSRGE
jgi:nickel/cobalt exporter